jgi:endo-1,4-beta-xylanase
MRSNVYSLIAIAGLSLIGACGGGGGVSEPSVKTCAEDPTQSKCVVVPPDSTLRLSAAKTGRYFGAAQDSYFHSSPAYDALLAKEFNMLTPGNVLKWDAVHPQRGTYVFTKPDDMLAFAQANGMKMRGHNLAWLNTQMPSWLLNGSFSADTLTQILKDHIATVVGHYAGKIYAWDVVNEAFAGNGTIQPSIWFNTLGKSYIETAFRAARAADPATLLFYNDYSLEFPGAKQDSAFALIQDFKARGVPIDGIGFQAHFQINNDGTGVPSKASLIATFQRFAALGVKIHLTELDIRVRTPGATQAELNAQSQGYSDVVGACVAVSACEAIVVWGITDAESWVPSTFQGYGQALLFDVSLNKKATYTAAKSPL